MRAPLRAATWLTTEAFADGSAGAEGLGEVRPGFGDADAPGAAVRGHGLGPAPEARVQLFEEALPVCLEMRALSRGEARQRVEDGAAHGPGVLRVQPVVGIPEAVNVDAPLASDPRRFGLEELDPFGCVGIVGG